MVEPSNGNGDFSPKKEGLINSIIMAILIAGLIFIVCPAYIVSNNLSELAAIPLAASAKTSLIAFIVIAIVLFAVLQIKTLRPIFFGFLIYVALAGLILPVTSASGMIDPANQPVNTVNLVACLFITISMGVAGFKIAIIRKLGMNIIAFIAVLNLGLSGVSIHKSQNAQLPNEPSRAGFTTLSSKKNIFVMSFDGVPGVTMSKVLDENAAFKSELKDFTYFPRTYSQSPATEASMYGELYGVQDFKSVADTIKGLRRKFSKTRAYKNSYFHKCDDFKHRYPRSVPGSKQTGLDFSELDQHSNLFLIQNSFSRIFTRYFFKTRIPSIFSKFLVQKTENSKFENELNHKGEKWDFKNVKTIQVYDKVVSSLTTSDKSPLAVRYYHTTFSHYPVDFDENCTYRSDDETWHKANQNEDGLNNQTECVALKMRSFLAKLKEIGVYDNSIIVLKSDHGEPVTYFETYPNNVTLNNHHRFGYNRYRPFLMIKDVGAEQPTLNYDDRLVLLNDLAKTLCRASRVKNVKCNAHGGINLLSDEKGLKQPYYLYIFKDGRSSYQFDTHISVKIPNRIVDPLSFLEDHPEVDVRERKVSDLP